MGLSAIMFTKILFALALVSLTSGYCSNSLDSYENTFNRSRQERDDYRRYYGCVESIERYRCSEFQNRRIINLLEEIDQTLQYMYNGPIAAGSVKWEVSALLMMTSLVAYFYTI